LAGLRARTREGVGFGAMSYTVRSLHDGAVWGGFDASTPFYPDSLSGRTLAAALRPGGRLGAESVTRVGGPSGSLRARYPVTAVPVSAFARVSANGAQGVFNTPGVVDYAVPPGGVLDTDAARVDPPPPPARAPFTLDASTLAAVVVGGRGVIAHGGGWFAVVVVSDGTAVALPGGVSYAPTLRAAPVADCAPSTPAGELPLFATAADGTLYLGRPGPAGPVARLGPVSTVGALAGTIGPSTRWAVEVSAGTWVVSAAA